MSAIRKFILDQLSVWPLAASNFRSMKAAATRTFDVGGLEVTAQYNPERITSSTAETDESTIGSRPCFLCPENRPQEQFHIRFEGRKGRSYNVQLNPYPIFPDHLVIVRSVHVPQSIAHVFVDAMDFCRANPGFLVFYNGPFSGASAPDHHHFQACHTGALPLQKAADVFLENPGVPLATNQDASLYHSTSSPEAYMSSTPQPPSRLRSFSTGFSTALRFRPESRSPVSTSIHIAAVNVSAPSSCSAPTCARITTAPKATSTSL